MTQTLQNKLNEVEQSLTQVRRIGARSVEPILHGIDTLILSVKGIDPNHTQMSENNLVSALNEGLEVLKRTESLARLEKQEQERNRSKWRLN